jgi:hypothetical protein
MTGFIVKNEKFEVKETDLYPPPSSVFYENRHNISQRYVLSNFNIHLTWANEFGENNNTFQIIYNEVVLLSIKVNRMQNIADYLNRFNTISKEELEAI